MTPYEELCRALLAERFGQPIPEYRNMVTERQSYHSVTTIPDVVPPRNELKIAVPDDEIEGESCRG